MAKLDTGIDNSESRVKQSNNFNRLSLSGLPEAVSKPEPDVENARKAMLSTGQNDF
jgi:hypothetical protein